MSEFSLDTLSPLLTNAYYGSSAYEAYQGFQVVEADIRAAHPEKYRALKIEDPRFSNSSWMRIHAWSLTYLTLACIKPLTEDGRLTAGQYAASLVFKPFAAVFDGAVNTGLLPIKLIVLIDRMVNSTFNALLQRNHPKGALTLGDAASDTGMQVGYMFGSLFKILIQPLNICASVISPKWDLFFYFGRISCAYKIICDQPGEERKEELLLDQSRVRYLREKCGWHHVSDEHFKSLGARGSQYALSYFDMNGKICIKAQWEQHIQVGNIHITIPREDRNY